MKHLAISLLATVAALAATSARAETRVSFGISVGAPIFYPAPPPAVVYAPPPPVVYAPPVVVYPAPAPRFAPVRVVPPGHYHYPGAVRRVYHHPYGYVPAPVYAHPYRGPCR